MSTRSVIMRRVGKDAVGVYHHNDGYPDGGVGQTLYETYGEFFKRDIRAMTAYFIDKHPAGWSTINGCDYSLPAGKYLNEWFEGKSHKDGKLSPEYIAWQEKHFPIPKCYCHKDGIRLKGEGYEAESLSLSGLIKENFGIEWAYVLDEEANTLEVYDCSHMSKATDRDTCFEAGKPPIDEPVPVAVIPLEGAEPDWKKIQCGEHLERCNHCAWYHFEELKDEKHPCHSLGTAQYLGYKPMTDCDVVAYIYKGVRYAKGRSGWRSDFRNSGAPLLNTPTSTCTWISSVIAPNGGHCNLAVGSVTPEPGVTWVFPPTKDNPNETLFTGKKVSAA